LINHRFSCFGSNTGRSEQDSYNEKMDYFISTITFKFKNENSKGFITDLRTRKSNKEKIKFPRLHDAALIAEKRSITK